MGKSNEPKKTALAQAREDVMVVVPKRLRYFLQRDTSLQGTVLRIFLSVVERCLRDHSPGCPADARIEAVAAQTAADEVMIATHAFDPSARVRSYELVAQAFGLEGAPPSRERESLPVGAPPVARGG